ncbi:hypothetical protein LJC68_06865 [Bacteroidales bacterium OttesenSCG-928-B11]|nr:hypothetical protein [Bacteroidales bacterium OttesenSCG-928-E04]MDL2308204.1 hypothetical protein [Bacteroidales bacterium OttesenSCG-928-C03]MDL2312582.1 hypothetical protein [Bacteroidales bacterium OttesenSCG-928-B11]MDL2325642.1 hypothetical protein [Bacteroidales bacterium OttesenSCG-928-A14]
MNPNYKKIASLLTVVLLISFISCQQKKVVVEEIESVELTQNTVESFAGLIVNALLLNNPGVFNEAFDKAYVRQQISDNSIVYSALDAEFGQLFFESNFRLGDKSLDVINRGGDFRFLKYYEKDGEHHVVFRNYLDYGLKIDDYIVDTVKGKIMIKDGFNYISSTTFVNQVRCNMLFDIMNRTNPEGGTKYFGQIRELLYQRNGREALRILEENRAVMEEYPLYKQYYLQSLMQVNPQRYLAQLDEMDGQALDHRSALLYKFLFAVNTGAVVEAEEIAIELIEFTGDDPIYLFMFGVANFHAGDYEAALYCYENALTGMRMIWDIWYGCLQCYRKLDDRENFDKTLEAGKELYGLNDTELQEIAKNLNFATANFE